jgi:hypothetical protein
MENIEQRIANAVRQTNVVRPPQQTLSTFGSTVIKYYLVTEPAYADLEDMPSRVLETVVREGTVRAEKPQVVTPYYLSNLEGFGENAEEYFQALIEEYGARAPGILYAYKNQGMETSVVSGSLDEVTARITDRLNKEDRKLEAVVHGVDDLWDVSLMKFIFELTNASVQSNASEMDARGLLDMQDGAPRDAHERIQHLLGEARRGNVAPADVHQELERWGLFEEYEDRFLALFGHR